MRHIPATLALIGAVLVFVLAGCTGSESESGEHNEEAESGERSEGSEAGEHREGAEAGEGGEESATQYTLSETFDEVRAGARLILSYDSNANAFTGTVQNTTANTLRSVRVEVHLSNGVELGPTTPVDLDPGQVAEVDLPATSEPFESWSAHPEVG